MTCPFASSVAADGTASGGLRLVPQVWAHPEGAERAVFSPDSARLLVAGPDGRVALWDVATGALLRIVEAHPGAVFSPKTLAFSESGDRFVTEFGHTVAVWRTHDGASLARWEHDSPVRSARLLAGGSRLLVGTDDSTHLHSVDGSEESTSIEGFAPPPTGRATTPDGAVLLVASDRTECAAFRPNGLRFDREVAVDRVYGPVGSAMLSDDGWLAMCRYADHTVVFDPSVGAVLWEREIRASELVVFPPGGRTVASSAAYPEDALEVWDVASGERVRALRTSHMLGLDGHEPAFTPDGRTVVVPCDGSPIVPGGMPRSAFCAWRDGQLQSTLEAEGASTGRRAWVSADGRRVVTGHLDTGGPQDAHLWDANTGRHLADLRDQGVLEPGEMIWEVVFSPDGRTVAVTFERGNVALFDAETGRLLRPAEGHDRSGVDGRRLPRRTTARAGFRGRTRMADGSDQRALLSAAPCPRRWDHLGPVRGRRC